MNAQHNDEFIEFLLALNSEITSLENDPKAKGLTIQLRDAIMEAKEKFDGIWKQNFLKENKGLQYYKYSEVDTENQLNILCIDDDPTIPESLQDLFHRKYNILHSASIEEAKESMLKHKIEVVICDYYLIDEIGTEFVRYMQKAYPEIPVIMLSGTLSSNDVIDCLNSGSYYFVQKPFSIDEIQKAIKLGLFTKAKRIIGKELKMMKNTN